jgi:ATP-dependent DNA helicase RecQ
MDMDKKDTLKRFFPDIKEFHSEQSEAIDALCDGENVLCLMPTGGGKSLIYQIAGLCMGKTTLIISPLIALMNQQHKQMITAGIRSINFSGMDGKKQFNTITSMASGALPAFIYMSPERVSYDGYLEYVLKLRSDDIGLVVIDEAHCVSQWGEGFRPAYRIIPGFINRVFDTGKWPRILCLTATLNEKDQVQIEKDFLITRTIKSIQLWRDNLHLDILMLKRSSDDKKDDELERLLIKHQGEKILVFVHRKYGKKATTGTLYEKYKDRFEGVEYFDAGLKDEDKERVLEGFLNGTVKIVFATSAFGMGVDISDIRVVINYLISESVEQYYQEVGRSGRDGKPAYCYLLYTQQSKRSRMILLNSSLCNETDLRSEYTDRTLNDGEAFRSVSFLNMTEEQKTAFSILLDYEVFSILAKGIINISCFVPKTEIGRIFIEECRAHFRGGLVKIIVSKSGQNISSFTNKIWDMCANGHLVMNKAIEKCMFYTLDKPIDDVLINEMLADQDSKRAERVSKFNNFTACIEDGQTAEQIIRSTLDI